MTAKRVCIAIGLLLIACQLIWPRKVYAAGGLRSDALADKHAKPGVQPGPGPDH
jgi:hypothetical protein